jgi:hypothetical protein
MRDVSTAAEERIRQNLDLDWRVIEWLSQELHSCGNPFINRFKHAYERLMDEGHTNPDPLVFLQIDSLHLELIAGCNTRTENLPTTEEVVGIISQVPADAGRQLYRDIQVRLWANDTTGHNPTCLIRVIQSHPKYMPLAYVLLFCEGDYGWCHGIQMQNPGTREEHTTIGQRVGLQYHLHKQTGQLSSLFFVQNMFQQYLVNLWAMCELNKLEYFYNN